MVRYRYDGWGNHKVMNPDGSKNESSTFIGNINPFRYRGYYYDVETGLYYLKTRYYDPEVGRFITIDDISYLAPDTINGPNLYAYCGNNPVMNVDPNGTFFSSALLIGVLVGTIVGEIAGGITETWKKGRQLKSIADETGTVTYGYDVFGLRNQKTIGGETTNCVYENVKLLRWLMESEVMTFGYGSEGVISFSLGQAKYLYRKKIFGDVKKIYKA